MLARLVALSTAVSSPSLFDATWPPRGVGPTASRAESRGSAAGPGAALPQPGEVPIDEAAGPRSQALCAEEAQYLAPGIQQISTLSGLAMERGRGSVLYDADGKSYLDLVAGIGVASIGHAHPALRRALAEQAARLTVGSFTSPARLELLKRVAERAPPLAADSQPANATSAATRDADPDAPRTQLYSGGAEAVESALRLARAVTGKHEVIGFWGGFHGKTTGVLGLLGGEAKRGMGPLPGGQLVAPYADCYRCPFKLEPKSCGLHCVEFLRQSIRQASTGSVAAILVEPMQGTAGNVIPPPGWLAAVKDVAREHDALLIADEMITGWGRTGRLWGVEHSGVRPDIVTFGKGVGGGVPLSGLIAPSRLVRALPWSRPSASSSSYGGNPLAAAAGAAVTRVIVEKRLPAQAEKVGAVFLEALRERCARFPFVGEVRGVGLLLAVELVEDRLSRRPLARPHCERLFHECLRRGLLTMAYQSRVRINPPLVMTRAQALDAAARFEEALAALSSCLGSGA